VQRVCRSRRYLAGLLRRSPLLDSAATLPAGPRPVDAEFRTFLEMADAPVSDDDEAGRPTGYPRGSSRV